MMRCAEVPGVEGESFNLGTGLEISVGDTASRILEELGIDLPIIVADDRKRPPNSEVERLVADISRARDRLNWQPEVGFDDGLRRTIDWLRGSLESFKPAIYNV
jgi:dTDP-glucose 4,6-dehydratase